MSHQTAPKQRPSITLFVGVVFIIMELMWMFMLTPWLADVSHGGVMLDMSPEKDTAALISRIVGYGSEGVAVYDRLQLFDLLFPAVYGALLIRTIRSGGNSTRLIRWGTGMTIAAACADYSENLIIRILLHDRDILLSGILTLPLYLITIVKFLLLGAAVTILLIKIVHTRRDHI